jgi:type IV pilus assembly protein PilE
MKNARGFTLIELMVVVIVIAVLAALALPSYLNQTRKSRRNAAEAAMQQIALLEERYRADNTGYLVSTGNWAKLGGDPSGTYYTYAVTIAAGPPPTYKITATGKSTQLKDVSSTGATCKTLTYEIDTTGVIVKSPTSCW